MGPRSHQSDFILEASKAGAGVGPSWLAQGEEHLVSGDRCGRGSGAGWCAHVASAGCVDLTLPNRRAG